MSDSEVISVISKKEKKCSFYFTKDSFSMYYNWMKDFFMIHNTIYESIGNNLENFYKIFDERFFDWLNQPKNSSKFMFEIKKEFMAIADEVLIYEIMIERFKNSENQFVIPLFEKNFENESDVEIDSYPDPEPCYILMEERQVLQEHVIDNESSNYDNEFYLSFFVKN
jgi:uncharacterized protein YihD (DUF1040 family)